MRARYVAIWATCCSQGAQDQSDFLREPTDRQAAQDLCNTVSLIVDRLDDCYRLAKERLEYGFISSVPK